MPAIEFSALNTMELRRLAKAARARGDGVLADQVDWEIVARMAHDGHPPAGAPAFGLEAEPDAGPEPGHGPDPDDGPEHDPDDDPDPGDDEAGFAADDAPGAAEAFARFEPEGPAAAGGGGRAWRGVTLLAIGAIAGGAVTGAGFWALDGTGRRGPAPVIDVLTVPGPPAPLTTPAPAGPDTEVARAEPPPAPAPRKVQLAATGTYRPVSVDACAGWSTTAERLACSDPEIAGLARRMDAARQRAIEAGADPRVTDETRWRQARDQAADPIRLAQLYERRIRELDAVAAEARDRGPIY